MARTLSERIADRMRNKKASVGAQNRGAFLALKAEIAQAIDDEWPIRSIWETLHEEGKVTFSYQAFRNYVNRLILGGKQAPKPKPKGKVSESVPALAPSQAMKETQPAPVAPGADKAKADPIAPASTGFNFDAKPKKEDYL